MFRFKKGIHKKGRPRSKTVYVDFKVRATDLKILNERQVQ